MPEGGRCDTKGCKGKGIVGLGSPPRWLCLGCFDASMKRTGERVRELAAALAQGPGRAGGAGGEP